MHIQFSEGHLSFDPAAFSSTHCRGVVHYYLEHAVHAGERRLKEFHGPRPAHGLHHRRGRLQAKRQEQARVGRHRGKGHEDHPPKPEDGGAVGGVPDPQLVFPPVVQEGKLHREKHRQNGLEEAGHDSGVVEVLKFAVHRLRSDERQEYKRSQLLGGDTTKPAYTGLFASE